DAFLSYSAAISATMRAWIFHTATSSGRMVNHPIGPTGSASEPAVTAALAAAEFASPRAASSGVLLGAVVDSGTSPTKLRIASAIFEAISRREIDFRLFSANMPIHSCPRSLPPQRQRGRSPLAQQISVSTPLSTTA